MKIINDYNYNLKIYINYYQLTLLKMKENHLYVFQ